MFELTFGGDDSFRDKITIDAEDFIAVKSFKAKGKRLTTFELASVVELEPKYNDDGIYSANDSDDETTVEDDNQEETVTERSDEEIRDGDHRPTTYILIFCIQ